MEPIVPDHCSWYIPAMHDFMARVSPSFFATFNFFKNHQAELGFDKVEHFLSVGSDDGQYDIKVLEAFTSCCHYIGIEPSKDAIISLGQNLMQHYPNIKQTLIQDKVEHWCGPTEKLDLILAAHVLYVIEEPRCKMLEKFLSWLKPGGLLVIVLSGESITHEARGKLKNVARTSINIYLYSKLKEDLQHLGAKIICEELYKLDVNVKTPTKQLADFLQFTDCTDEEVQEVYSILNELAPNGVGHTSTWVTVVKKD